MTQSKLRPLQEDSQANTPGKLRPSQLETKTTTRPWRHIDTEENRAPRTRTAKQMTHDSEQTEALASGQPAKTLAAVKQMTLRKLRPSQEKSKPTQSQLRPCQESQANNSGKLRPLQEEGKQLQNLGDCQALQQERKTLQDPCDSQANDSEKPEVLTRGNNNNSDQPEALTRGQPSK